MDLPGCRDTHPGFGYQGDPERRRAGQECLLAVRRWCGYWDKRTLRRNDPGQNADRHEHRRIDEWQTLGTNGSDSPEEHCHERSVERAKGIIVGIKETPSPWSRPFWLIAVDRTSSHLGNAGNASSLGSRSAGRRYCCPGSTADRSY